MELKLEITVIDNYCIIAGIAVIVQNIKYIIVKEKGGENLLPEILLFTIAGFILLILLILSLPYHYKMRFTYADKLYYNFKIGTFFFYFKSYKFKEEDGTYIKVFNMKKNMAGNKKEPEKEEEKTGLNKLDLLTILNIEDIKHFLKFGRVMWLQIKPEVIQIDLDLSFSDPYYNGLILACYYSCREIYHNFPANISVDWEREVVEGKGKIKGGFVPLFILGRAITFVLSPRSVKMIWKIIKKRKV